MLHEPKEVGTGDNRSVYCGQGGCVLYSHGDGGDAVPMSNTLFLVLSGWRQRRHVRTGKILTMKNKSIKSK